MLLKSSYTRHFVLAYLALFVNLGPSLHRAPVFGFHDSESHASCGCGCCSILTTASDGLEGSWQRPECDCALCDFFKYTQAEIAESCMFFEETVFQKSNPPVATFVAARQISQFARGPPTRLS